MGMRDLMNTLRDDTSIFSCDYPDDLVDDIKESDSREDKVKAVRKYLMNNSYCVDIGDLEEGCEVYIDDLVEYIEEDNEDDCFDIHSRVNRIALCECGVSFVT